MNLIILRDITQECGIQLFCIICILFICVSYASGDHMMETYSRMDLVMALYVSMIDCFCFPPMLLM